jgi:hypothetical protein
VNGEDVLVATRRKCETICTSAFLLNKRIKRIKRIQSIKCIKRIKRIKRIQRIKCKWDKTGQNGTK